MTDDAAVLLGHLRSLEIELHGATTRHDAGRLDALLHADFAEFGRSGTVYSRGAIIALLTGDPQPATVVADRFALRRLAPDVALLTYRSAHAAADGSLHRHTLRTSMWQRTGSSWQMSFHQGTPTAAFTPAG